MIRPDAPNGGSTRSATPVTTSWEVAASARAEARSLVRAGQHPAAGPDPHRGPVAADPELLVERPAREHGPTGIFGHPGVIVGMHQAGPGVDEPVIPVWVDAHHGHRVLIQLQQA